MEISITLAVEIDRNGKKTSDYICSIDHMDPKTIHNRFVAAKYILDRLGMTGVSVVTESDYEKSATVVWGAYQAESMSIDGYAPTDILNFCEKVLAHVKEWLGITAGTVRENRTIAPLFIH
jgi:hypothetical protein